MPIPSVITGAAICFQDGSGNPVPVSATNPLPVTAAGGGTYVSLVTFPASAIATGTRGQMAYSAGFAALCVAANTWVFWPTSSDYPF